MDAEATSTTDDPTSHPAFAVIWEACKRAALKAHRLPPDYDWDEDIEELDVLPTREDGPEAPCGQAWESVMEVFEALVAAGHLDPTIVPGLVWAR